MTEPRKLTSLGRLRWSSASAPVLDQRLSSVLLDNITARIAVVDTESYYLYANREMCEFFGLPPEQVIGRHLSDLIGAESYARYSPYTARVVAGEALRLEGWVNYPGQGPRYLRETFIPYGPEDGPVECIAVFGRDGTDLKRREQELTDKLAELDASEALKSAIFDHALAALVTTDGSGSIVEFNPAAEAMFGRTRAEVMGRAVGEVMIPERFREPHERGMRRMQQSREGRILGRRLEMHALRADGSEFPIEMVLWRTDVKGSAFYTASFNDLSERRDAALQIGRQREALRQSEKLTAMGSLLAGVAHELNNPLAIVMGRASLLEEKCDALPDLKADAQRIREAADRCGRILRTFLNMARSRPLQRGPVAFNEMIRAAADMLQYGYRTHGIELHLALADSLPEVTADGDQIGQIVMNLLVNAQQALTAAQGTRSVQVETGLEVPGDGGDPRVWLRVADNGPGVSGAARARLFEPFFTTKPEGVGTGLGLAVSRSLARDHGGDLTLEPESPQGGASFRLSLPVSGAARSGTVETAPREPSVEPQARVLVVDDEAELAEVMRAMLEGAGYEVVTAESGAVALELLDTARFDAIVSDLRMPDMDGAGLWRHVGAHHPLLAGRLLFVTGDTLSPDAREFLHRSRSAWLDKPFSKSDLLDRLAGLLA